MLRRLDSFERENLFLQSELAVTKKKLSSSKLRNAALKQDYHELKTVVETLNRKLDESGEPDSHDAADADSGPNKLCKFQTKIKE